MKICNCRYDIYPAYIAVVFAFESFFMNINFFPHVSILLSVFNGGDNYLSDTVKSILKQSYADFEFIIIDDGSNDNTQRILAEFCKIDSRIRALRNETNQGLIKSLNRAMDQASTQFIARIDCGDIAGYRRIELQYEFLRKNTDYILVSSQANWMTMDGKRLFTTKYPCSDDEIRKRLFVKDNIIVHPAVMFKKIEGLYFREMASTAEDYDYWLRLSMAGKFFIFNEPLLTVRLNPDGTTYSKKYRQIKTVDKIHRSFFLNIGRCPEDESKWPAVKLNRFETMQEKCFYFFTKKAIKHHYRSNVIYFLLRLLSGLSSPYYLFKLIRMRLKLLTASYDSVFQVYLSASDKVEKR